MVYRGPRYKGGMKKPAKPLDKRPEPAKVSVLMPPSLRDSIKERARKNLRSLSAEIVATLQTVGSA